MKNILLFTISLLAAVARGDGLPTGPFIYAIGKAQRTVNADIVTLTVIVSAAHEDQSTARKKVATDSTTVFAVLEQEAIPSGDISSHQISAEAEYDYQNRTRKLTGYRVAQVIVVTIRNVSRVADIASRLMTGDIVKVEVVAVRNSKQDELERDLMAVALKDARRRADDIARETGLRVVSVHAVSPVGFSDVREKFLGRQEQGMKVFGSDPGGLKIHIPQVELASTAHVIFNVATP